MTSKTSQHTGKAYAVNCDCGFSAKGYNQNELEEVGSVHARRSHPDMKLGPNDIKQLVKAV